MKKFLLSSLLIFCSAMAYSQSDTSHQWLIPEKNVLAFKISIPEGNFFFLNKGNEYGNTFGFLGISCGFEYYLNDKHYLNADFGALTDFNLPFPAPYDHMGKYNRSFAVYGDIQFGTDFKRFHIDAGLQGYRTTYQERETFELFPNYVDSILYEKHQTNIGLAFSTYYRITKRFQVGINYYPSFIAIENNSSSFHYGHLLFFELAFRFEAYRPKRDFVK